MLNGKRAQFFIVAAFIVAGIIIGLSKVNNYIILPGQPFAREEVNKELNREAGFSVNYALNTSKDSREVMENFSKSYVAYSRTKMPNSQYFFIYAEPETSNVTLFAFGNKSEIIAVMDNYFFFYELGGDFLRATRFRNASDDQVNVTFYGSNYTFNIKSRDFKHIMRVEDEKGIWVSS